jgi:hypothetical protein
MAKATIGKFDLTGVVISEWSTDKNGESFSPAEQVELLMGIRPKPYVKPSFLEEGTIAEVDVDSEQIPNWLYTRITRYFETYATAGAVAQAASQEAGAGLIKANNEFVASLHWVLDALDDNPSPATQKCLEMLMRRVGWDLHVALRDTLSAWRREYRASQEGIKHGHAAYGEHSWLVELDRRPEWMEHKVKANGKVDWKISDRIILKELNNFRDVIVPGSHTTIGRERNKRRLTLK